MTFDRQGGSSGPNLGQFRRSRSQVKVPRSQEENVTKLVGAISSEGFSSSICFTLKLAQNVKIEQLKSTKRQSLSGLKQWLNTGASPEETR